MRRPTAYMVSSISSKGMSCFTPLRDSSAAMRALATPAALRFWQGYSTRPPTGSHTRPSRFISTVEPASIHCSGVPPISSTVAHLRLTAAHRPRHSGVAHGQIAHGSGVEQGVHKAVVGDLIAVLEGQQQPGHNPGRARGGGRHDEAHGGVYLSHPHGIGHGPLEDVPADGLTTGGVVVEFFGFSADKSAHGFGRLFQRQRGGGPHDLQHFGHAVVYLIPGGLPQLALPAAHDL